MENYKLYGTDYFGKNNVDDLFQKNIMPLLKKCKLSKNDMDSLVNNIQEVYYKGHSNGYNECINEERDGGYLI